jgi:DNA-binding NtrC family response regulator
MRLLLVEDDLELSRRLSDRLRQSGFAVDLAANAADAIEWPDLNHFGSWATGRRRDGSHQTLAGYGNKSAGTYPHGPRRLGRQS